MSVLDASLARGVHGSRSRHGSGASLAAAGGSSGSLSESSGSPAAGRIGSSSDLRADGGGDLSAGPGDAAAGAGACAGSPPGANPGNARPRSGPADASSRDGATPDAPIAPGSAAQQSGRRHPGSDTAAGCDAAAHAAPEVLHAARLPPTFAAVPPQPQHRESGDLSDASDVEEDRQRLAAAAYRLKLRSLAAAPAQTSGAAGASLEAARPAMPPRQPGRDSVGAAPGGAPAGGPAASGGAGALAGGLLASGRPDRMQAAEAGVEIAPPLPSGVELQQHPLQEAFRAAQQQLQPAPQVRGAMP